MNKKTIYCKSSIALEQLSHREDCNTNGVELQLLEDFIYAPLEVDEYINNIKPYIHLIKVIHAPLKRGEDITELQMLDDEETQKVFFKICKLAQAIADINKEDITIVIHNKWNKDDFNFHKESYTKVIDCLTRALEQNKNIKIAIENVIPFLIGKKYFSNGCLPDFVDIIKELRSSIGTDRIGSVIDTCHALVTINFYNTIEASESIGLNLKLEDYFKASEDFCFLIHLCDVNGFGYKKNSHGVTFTEETEDRLEEILLLHNIYTDTTPITIEVLEEDYTNCVNYEKTRTMISNILTKN